MQYSLQVFHDHDNDRFRVIDKNGDPWFVLADVCRKLGLTNPSQAAAALDDDEKDALRISDGIGRNQTTIIVSESGLYELIMRSTKPEAKRLRKWVTKEVLPSIRKTGGYGHNSGYAFPDFIRRANENWRRVTPGHFSVCNEVAIHLYGRLERAGRVIASRAPDGKQNRPDVSVGLVFAKWLKDHHPHLADSHSTYLHKTDEWEGEVRQYPHSMWLMFVNFLDDVWIPKYAEAYLKVRDPASLPYLQMALQPPTPPREITSRYGRQKRR
jgi:prophage antirepressor-like protein